MFPTTPENSRKSKRSVAIDAAAGRSDNKNWTRDDAVMPSVGANDPNDNAIPSVATMKTQTTEQVDETELVFEGKLVIPAGFFRSTTTQTQFVPKNRSRSRRVAYVPSAGFTSITRKKAKVTNVTEVASNGKLPPPLELDPTEASKINSVDAQSQRSQQGGKGLDREPLSPLGNCSDQQNHSRGIRLNGVAQPSPKLHHTGKDISYPMELVTGKDVVNSRPRLQSTRKASQQSGRKRRSNHSNGNASSQGVAANPPVGAKAPSQKKNKIATSAEANAAPKPFPPLTMMFFGEVSHASAPWRKNRTVSSVNHPVDSTSMTGDLHASLTTSAVSRPQPLQVVNDPKHESSAARRLVETTSGAANGFGSASMRPNTKAPTRSIESIGGDVTTQPSRAMGGKSTGLTSKTSGGAEASSADRELVATVTYKTDNGSSYRKHESSTARRLVETTSNGTANGFGSASMRPNSNAPTRSIESIGGDMAMQQNRAMGGKSVGLTSKTSGRASSADQELVATITYTTDNGSSVLQPLPVVDDRKYKSTTAHRLVKDHSNAANHFGTASTQPRPNAPTRNIDSIGDDMSENAGGASSAVVSTGENPPLVLHRMPAGGLTEVESDSGSTTNGPPSRPCAQQPAISSIPNGTAATTIGHPSAGNSEVTYVGATAQSFADIVDEDGFVFLDASDGSKTVDRASEAKATGRWSQLTILLVCAVGLISAFLIYQAAEGMQGSYPMSSQQDYRYHPTVSSFPRGSPSPSLGSYPADAPHTFRVGSPSSSPSTATADGSETSPSAGPGESPIHASSSGPSGSAPAGGHTEGPTGAPPADPSRPSSDHSDLVTVTNRGMAANKGHDTDAKVDNGMIVDQSAHPVTSAEGDTFTVGKTAVGIGSEIDFAMIGSIEARTVPSVNSGLTEDQWRELRGMITLLEIWTREEMCNLATNPSLVRQPLHTSGTGNSHIVYRFDVVFEQICRDTSAEYKALIWRAFHSTPSVWVWDGDELFNDHLIGLASTVHISC